MINLLPLKVHYSTLPTFGYPLIRQRGPSGRAPQGHFLRGACLKFHRTIVILWLIKYALCLFSIRLWCDDVKGDIICFGFFDKSSKKNFLIFGARVDLW